jgi:ATP-binding cassette subfamily B protein
MKKSILKSLPYLIIVVFVAIVCAALDGYMSIVMMHSIDTVTSKDMVLFKQEVVKLLIIALMLIPATISLAYVRGLYKRKAIVSAKVNYIKGVFNKNINEFQKDNNTKYISTLTNDVNTIENNYIDGLYEMVVLSVNFIVGILVIGFVSPMALGFGVGIGVVSTLISIFLSKPLQRHHAQRSDLYESYTTYIKEVLSAFHIIKSNNLNDKVSNDFRAKSHAIQHKGYIIDKISTFIFSLQHLTMGFTFTLLLGAIALVAINGDLTLGGAILVISNMEKIIQPLSQAGEWLPKIFATKLLFIKIEDTLKNQDNYEETITIDKLDKAIDFSNVSFSYDDTQILKGINLTLEKGGKYLVIGPSGGGKSTLLKLLRKYYLPNSGHIMIDGKNLKDVTKDSYFHHISNVEQQVFLFEDTVRNNICLYKDYTDEEINIAIEKAGLKDFIAGLTEGLGLNSIIYDNGKNVSGGEKSRIALARGLLQKADIILLDEAFASLDSKIAKEIEKTILGLDNITVINVSHVIFEDTKRKYNKVFMVKNKSVFSV